MTSPTLQTDRPTVRRGFTLVELLVVMGIIIVLIGILVPTLIRAYSAADKTKAAADLQSIGVALEAYRGDFGDYPRIDRSVATGYGQDTGAVVLCKALVGAGGTVEPVATPYATLTSYNPGDLVSYSGVNYVYIRYTTGTINAGNPAVPSVGSANPYWAPWLTVDGLNGPGFRIRQQGKVYAPYLQMDRFKIVAGGTMLADLNNNPILYYPASINKPNVYAVPSATNGGYVAKYNPAFPMPLYCASDNLGFMSLVELQAELGDYSTNQAIDTVATATNPGEAAIGNYPYLLFAAGPDSSFGPVGVVTSATTLAKWQTNKIAAAGCDDVTNIQR